jgi:hypothetical protein
VDPEARPSISQLLAAFAAMATGKPLPHYEIPPEAVERRREREITAKKREEKNKSSKKIAPKITPLKPSGPLDSNSVAARRLAMKKGVDPSGGHSAHPAPHVVQEADTRYSDSTSDSFFDADFGAHAKSGAPTATASASVSARSTVSANASAAIQKSFSKDSNGWDLDHRPPSSAAFSDPWGPTGTSSYDNCSEAGSQHFDAFGDGIGLKPATQPTHPVTKTQSKSSQAASLFDWSEPDTPIKSTGISPRSSHETLNSVNSGPGPSVFTTIQSTDSDMGMGFSAFGNSPKNPHSAPFAFDSSSSSLFPSAPATTSRPVSARHPSHQERSLDFLSDTTPHQHPTAQSERVTPVQTPAKAHRPLPPTPSVAARGTSEPVSMPSYEVDLFDTTPGPPVIDFLSLDEPSYRSTTSSYVSRQQAHDVLSLFDNESAPRTPMRSACPDLTKSLQSNSVGGFGMGQGTGLISAQLKLQQQQIQQQQQQQQSNQRPLSFPLPGQQRLPQESMSQRPLSNNYPHSPVVSGQGAAGRNTQH